MDLSQAEARWIPRYISSGAANVLCESGLVEFRDDGPGYPEYVLQMEGHGTGLEIIWDIVQRGLRGGTSLHNDGGAVAEIRFTVQPQDESERVLQIG